jgi:hypothetical protein
VYSQNAKALGRVGVQLLEDMLRKRDWAPLEDHKVNRKELDALRIAQDFQETGAVRAEDLSLAGDASPAANRVDRRQVEQGDLVTVLLQALGKRLGHEPGGAGGAAASATGSAQPLSGPETSASAMAADFLIQRLEAMAAAEAPPATRSAPPPMEASEHAAGGEASRSSPQDVTARQARIEAARRALLDDFGPEGGAGSSGGGDDVANDVLFGKGGIPDRPDEQFNKGLDPSSFY